MNLFILLQDNVTNITRVSPNDIAWRTTDVIYVCAGLLSAASAWFIMKGAQDKMNDRIDKEVASGDAKRQAITREFELHVEKHKALEARINTNENAVDTLETSLGKEISVMGKEIANMNLSIEKMKSEILSELIKKKR